MPIWFKPSIISIKDKKDHILTIIIQLVKIHDILYSNLAYVKKKIPVIAKKGQKIDQRDQIFIFLSKLDNVLFYIMVQFKFW